MESANELYPEIVEQAPDGVIVASIEGTILLWNDRAGVIFGYATSAYTMVGCRNNEASGSSFRLKTR